MSEAFIYNNNKKKQKTKKRTKKRIKDIKNAIENEKWFLFHPFLFQGKGYGREKEKKRYENDR